MFKRFINQFLIAILSLLFWLLPAFSDTAWANLALHSNTTLIAQSASCNTNPQRITFRPGSFAASVQKVLTPSCIEANYIIGARKGQLMVLVLTSPNATRFSITFPDGGGDGGPVGQGGVIFNQTLPANGDYRIHISESTMAQLWTGQFTLTVVIQ